MVGDLDGNNVDLWDTMFQVEKNQINARIPCKLLYMGHLDWNIVLSFHHQWCLNPWYRKVYFAKSRGEMLWSIVRHQFFWPIKDMFLKVGITSTSLYFMEWGCMDSSHVEGFNNLGTKKSSSLVQSHAPTSSIEDEPIFTKSDEDKATPNNFHPIMFPIIVMIVLMAIIVLRRPTYIFLEEMVIMTTQMFLHWDVVIKEEMS